MPIRESSYGTWTSHHSFIRVAAGAAMGIGNVARLPYLTGEYGGAAFLLVYALALLVIGWPMVVTELALGRWTRQDPYTTLQSLAVESKARPAWGAIGALSCLTAVLVLSYFSVVAGWSIAYAMRGASGLFEGMDAAAAQKMFLELARDPERSLAWHTIFMVTIAIAAAHGFREGIERTMSYLFPPAVALGLFLLFYGWYFGDGNAAVAYLFDFNWPKLGWRGALEALHQAFFTLGLGAGIMMVYGSYLPAKTPIGRLAARIIVIDALFSLAIGVGLYALIFASARDAAPGLSLLFQILPQVMPTGIDGAFGAVFVYLVIFIITLSAALALLEPGVRYLMDRHRITRVFASVYLSVMIWFLGVGSLLSFNVTEHLEFFGRNFFDWMQWLTGRLLLPALGLLLCIFAGRILPVPLLREIWGDQPEWLYKVWRFALRYPTRVALIVLMFYCLGVLDFLVALWAPA
ncbi:MAG: sodium-dependent transporter [Pseudomonadota bacterium]